MAGILGGYIGYLTGKHLGPKLSSSDTVTNESASDDLLNTSKDNKDCESEDNDILVSPKPEQNVEPIISPKYCSMFYPMAKNPGHDIRIAAADGNTGALEDLLDRYPEKINTQDSNQKYTPLHYAVKFALHYRKFGTILLLLDKGADNAIRDKQGKTPLDHAEQDDEIRQCFLPHIETAKASASP